MAGSVGVVGGVQSQRGPEPVEVVLQRVYEEHRDRLVGLFVRSTGDPDLAEDLAHDVMVRLAGAAGRLDPGRPVWPYLRAIAHNVLVDHRRGASRAVDRDVCEELVDEPVPGDGLDDTVVLRRLLDGAIGDLSDRQRVAVELRCAREWNVAESAAFLGIDPGAFRQLLFRARRSLRETLDAAGARARGVALPLVLGVRLGVRSVTERVRELLQPTVPFGEALAGVAVAATLGVTAVVGAPAAGAERSVPSSSVLELVRQDVSAAVGQTVVEDPEVAVGDRYTAPSAPTATADGVPGAAGSPPSGASATVIHTPDAVPNSNGNVTVNDDEERFVVSHEIAARTDVEEVGSTGEAVAIDCDNAAGELLCGQGRSSGPELTGSR